MNKKHLIVICLILCLISSFMLSGCRLRRLRNRDTESVTTEAPTNPETAMPENKELNEELMAQAVNAIENEEFGQIHSLLVHKDGALVFEEYFEGNKYNSEGEGAFGDWVKWDKEMPHRVMSVSKSITSALVGIAIDKGFIESEQQSIFDYLPEHTEYKNEGREDIQLAHLLTMTGGIDWEKGQRKPLIAATAYGGTVEEILRNPIKYQPGTHFQYNGGNTDLLGEIIKKASGMSFEDFAEENLFSPLGIDCEWIKKPGAELAHAAGGAVLTPRDMIKFGVLYLNGGKWKGEQIVSEGWIEQSFEMNGDSSWYQSTTAAGSIGEKGYGYSWWMYTYRTDNIEERVYFAGGWGGQMILIAPQYNAVAVVTAGNYTSENTSIELLDRYVIPAIR